MAIYTRIHALLLPHCCSHGAYVCPYIWLYIRVCMPHCCPHIWPCMRACMPHYCPIAAPMGPMYAPIYSYIYAYACPIAAPIYGHVCAHTCPIAAPVWPIYARIYALLSGTKIRTIRKAVKKRQALCLIWTSLLALAIYSLWGQEWAMYKSNNGPYMRVCMPH